MERANNLESEGLDLNPDLTDFWQCLGVEFLGYNPSESFALSHQNHFARKHSLADSETLTLRYLTDEISQ